jgi:hypothetical protein
LFRTLIGAAPHGVEEGGYQNNPDDPGNWTSGECGEGKLIRTDGGISAPELIAWLSPHEV